MQREMRTAVELAESEYRERAIEAAEKSCPIKDICLLDNECKDSICAYMSNFIHVLDSPKT